MGRLALFWPSLRQGVQPSIDSLVFNKAPPPRPVKTRRYWVVVLLVVPPSLLVMLLARRHLLMRAAAARIGELSPPSPRAAAAAQERPSAGDPTGVNIEYTPGNTLLYPAICTLAGMAAGLFGLGG
jgi:hypothetical protein